MEVALTSPKHARFVSRQGTEVPLLFFEGEGVGTEADLGGKLALGPLGIACAFLNKCCLW
jgi:hypothetical protein